MAEKKAKSMDEALARELATWMDVMLEEPKDEVLERLLVKMLAKQLIHAILIHPLTAEAFAKEHSSTTRNCNCLYNL